MTNPFPGMNPYLEGSEWHNVHVALCVEIGRQLVPLVRPKYAVRTEQRTVTVAPDPTEVPRFPDVALYEQYATLESLARTAVLDSPIVCQALMPVPVPHTTVKVWEVASKRLVTAIEVLSPTNKRGKGRREYETKRDKFLASRSHFMEIDFLRVGRRFPVDRELPKVPYFVFLSRADRRNDVLVWPIPIDQPLPTVPVPLLPGDDDVALNLQTALTAVCQDFALDEAFDYTQQPPGRLNRPQRQWLDRCLRAAGLRN